MALYEYEVRTHYLDQSRFVGLILKDGIRVFKFTTDSFLHRKIVQGAFSGICDVQIVREHLQTEGILQSQDVLVIRW